MRVLFAGAVVLAALGLYVCAAQQLPCDPTCNQGDCVADHGTLSCRCYGNWTGPDCSTFICDREQICLNGGTCAHHPTNVSQYVCACPLGFTGLRCQYKIAGAACTTNPCGANGTCYNLGSGGHECLCQEGFVGPQCQFADPTRRCDSLNCNNRGTCEIQVDMAKNGTDFRTVCKCEDGFASNFQCLIPLNSTGNNYCVENPCSNRGTCDYVFNSSIAVGYQCTCPPQFTGVNCSTPFEICSTNPCMNVGTCQPILEGNYYSCQCPPNYTGYNCEYIINPCERCGNLSGCTVNTPRSRDPNGLYHSNNIDLQVDVQCDCPCGFTGHNCDVAIRPDHCDPDPCLNGGECVPEVNGYRCNCPTNYGGHNCSFEKRCASVPCSLEHTERCVNDFEHDSFVCVCERGWGGELCTSDLDECLESPCNGEPCENLPGSYQCLCSSNKTGQNCENFITDCSQLNCTNDGECVSGAGFVYCNCSSGFTGALCETELCLDDCARLAGNGVCDSQCYTEGCNYDGGDCSIRPLGDGDLWAQCPECREKFNNGQCDVECTRAECYHDGQDCEPKCPHVEECMQFMEDGVCSTKCITQQCPFDYVDCQGKPRFTANRLVLILLAPVDRPFETPWSTSFLDDLSKLTNSIAVLVSRRTLTLEELSESCPPHLKPCDQQKIRDRLVYEVVIELDIQYCTSHCPTDAQDAVNWIQANYNNGRSTIGPYGIADAYTEPGSPDTQSPSFQWYYGVIIGLIVIMILGTTVGILIGKRKRIIAKTWRPQSPSSESDRSNSSPRNEKRKLSNTSGGAVTGTVGTTVALHQVDSEEFIAEGIKKAKMEHVSGQNRIKWSDVRVAENPVGTSSASSTQQTDTVVVGQVGKDTRKWNIAHYEAMRDPRRVRQLLADYRRQNGLSVDVNAPGPGGYTPLMLVVMKQHHGSHESLVPLKSRSSSESSSDHNEYAALIGLSTRISHNGFYGARPSSIVSHNGVFSVIPPVDSSVSVLLEAKVDLDAVNDYGQTALHLAAACSRGDYVEQLLDAGANPNLQDNWGQSPLQAAIGAAAEGAFMILLNHPRLDLTQKSDGGITHLMSAVKIVNQFMVKQLLKKNVDIAATDNDGRTAVHWAAMVDNLEALKLLIRHGPDTIKDAQDNKGQTALFLACREGSASCVKHLLDCFANATLLDNLDRSPMDIAAKKMHTDIIDMLRSTSHGFYHPGHSRTQMVSYMQDPTAVHPMYHPHQLTRPVKSKSHTRQTSRERLIQDSVPVYSQGEVHHRELANAYCFNTPSTTSQHNETFADLLKAPSMQLDPSGGYTSVQPQTSSMLPSSTAEMQYHTTQQSSPLSHNVDIAASHQSYQYPSSSGYVATSNQVLPVTTVPVTTHPPMSNGFTELLPVSTSSMPPPPLTTVDVAAHDQVYDGYSQHQPTTDQSTQYSLYTQGYTFDAHAMDVTTGSTRRLQHLPLATEASIQQQQYTGVVSDQMSYHPPNQMYSPPQPNSNNGPNSSGSPNSSVYRSPPNSAHSYPYSSPHSLTPSPPDPMSQETHVNAHGTITVQPDYGGIPQHQLSKLFVANHNQLESSV